MSYCSSVSLKCYVCVTNTLPGFDSLICLLLHLMVFLSTNFYLNSCIAYEPIWANLWTKSSYLHQLSCICYISPRYKLGPAKIPAQKWHPHTDYRMLHRICKMCHIPTEMNNLALKFLALVSVHFMHFCSSASISIVVYHFSFFVKQ